ncbi:hypothetical protein H175_328p133 (plasmid) [Bacillus thuringiensis serovar thuringiensis str. IS5056]|nr:hypothetical protein H175_328p133 [Bacillus thuringiensis serovar thuringiensis str. IS5056]
MYLYEMITYIFSYHFSKGYKAIRHIKIAIRLLDKQKKYIYACYTKQTHKIYIA